MKGLLRISIVWCWMSLLVATGQAQTNNFSFIVTPSTNAVPVNGSISFAVVLTNLTGLNFNDVLISNVPSDAELFLGVTNNPALTNALTPITYFPITNSTGLVFDFGPMLNGAVAGMTVTYQTVNTGVLTNFFQVVGFASSVLVTNTAATNNVTQVFSGQADLAVAIKLPIPTVITNDYTYFTLSVTNFGPGAAANVLLTNALPAGLYWFGLFPTNQTFATNGNSQYFNLGTMASGAFTNITYLVAPTNLAAYSLSASVGAQDLLEANITNNYATNTLVATNYAFRVFVAPNAPLKVNFQNGLLEQSILLANSSGSNASAVRVVVTGLFGLTNYLFNAVGTNFGDPFVVYNGPLATGQVVQLLLQYAPRGNGTLGGATPVLRAFALAAANFSAPVPTGTTTNLNFTRIVPMANGEMLLEFPATEGKTYTVVYSDNVLFSNAMIAPPVVTANANKVQWIDYGPPTTVSVPANSPTRFYRVYQNP